MISWNLYRRVPIVQIYPLVGSFGQVFRSSKENLTIFGLIRAKIAVTQMHTNSLSVCICTAVASTGGTPLRVHQSPAEGFPPAALVHRNALPCLSVILNTALELLQDTR